MRQDGGVLLHDEVDVAQRHILDLGLRGQQGHQRGRHLLEERLLQGFIVDAVQLLEDELPRAHNLFGEQARMPCQVVCRGACELKRRHFCETLRSCPRESKRAYEENPSYQ